MRTLRVELGERAYDIHIGRDILKESGKIIGLVTKSRKAFIVTDENVEPLHADVLCESLFDAGFDAELTVIPAGEKSKSLEMLGFLYDSMLSGGITRSDIIIALGGGVVGDLTGLCAATLLRGVDYVQIPTTLLAQVDSSVGGKTAIDVPSGKNLVGAFYQPKTVIIDTKTLETLPGRVFSDGMAEVIKYGLIRDAELYKQLEKCGGREGVYAEIEDIVHRCCDIKRGIVENDERDTGERMILNFGHTFGHAIERKYNYETYTHGEAVAAGMVMAAEFGEKIGMTAAGISQSIRKILKDYGLPTDIELDRDSLGSAVMVDKKGDGGLVNLILLEDIGKAIIKQFAKDDVIKGNR